MTIQELNQVVALDRNAIATNEKPIRVGVITRPPHGAGCTSTEWVEAHSILRCKNGSFVVYRLDDKRTHWHLSAKDFAGVSA